MSFEGGGLSEKTLFAPGEALFRLMSSRRGCSAQGSEVSLKLEMTFKKRLAQRRSVACEMSKPGLQRVGKPSIESVATRLPCGPGPDEAPAARLAAFASRSFEG